MSVADEHSGGMSAVLARWLVILGGLGIILHLPVLPRETHKGDADTGIPKAESLHLFSLYQRLLCSGPCLPGT